MIATRTTMNGYERIVRMWSGHRWYEQTLNKVTYQAEQKSSIFLDIPFTPGRIEYTAAPPLEKEGDTGIIYPSQIRARCSRQDQSLDVLHVNVTGIDPNGKMIGRPYERFLRQDMEIISKLIWDNVPDGIEDVWFYQPAQDLETLRYL